LQIVDMIKFHQLPDF